MDKDVLDILEEIKPEFDFNDSEDFVMDGLLDSFDIISIVSMLEEKYGITIDGLDIVPENFSSVNSIVELVIKSGGKVE
ncbi:MAG: acyl carrier protein [Saccharofermentans sp.]|nr:acyl carrier protein [Saccharofermentans sp.]